MTTRNINLDQGKQILDVLTSINLTQNQFAKCIGVSRQYVNLVVQGKRQLKLDRKQALNLERNTPRDANFWLSLSASKDDESYHGSEEPEMELQNDLDVEKFEPSDKNELERLWSRTGPRILTDGEIAQAVELHYLEIDPFNEEMLCPTKLYTTIASKALVTTETDCETVSLDDGWELERDEMLTVQSEEYFKMPGKITAELGQVAQNVRSGINVHHGLGIDPSWEGRLVCRLENRASLPVTIRTGMKLLCVRFQFVATKPLRRYRPVDNPDVEAGFSEIDFRTAGRNGHNRKRRPQPPINGADDEQRRARRAPASGNDFERTVADFLRTQSESLQANAQITAEFLAYLKERRGEPTED